MPLDRDETLKQAERLLRQGRLDQAIAEYARVVDEHPHDWTSANQLGDLYARSGQVERAIAEFSRCTDELLRDRSLSKAAAVCRKILKIAPADERAQLQLAEIALQQGLLMDARASFTAVAEQRRRNGDEAGAHEMGRRAATLESGDFDGRVSRARARVRSGEFGAIGELRKLIDHLLGQSRDAEAIEALRDMIALDTADLNSRRMLAHTLLRTGNDAAACELLTEHVAGDDRVLLAARAEYLLRERRFPEAREAIQRLLASGDRASVEALAARLTDTDADVTFACVEALADSRTAAGEWNEAAALLRPFAQRRPDYIPGLLKCVELCVDAGLDAETCEAQGMLADAYIENGAGEVALVIARDLMRQQPDIARHRERHEAALRLVGHEEADDDQFAAFLRDDDAPPVPQQPAAPDPSGEIDLTAALSRFPTKEEDGPETPSDSLEEVFHGFRSEVARERADEVAEQHFKLAMSYREIGMLEDAIEALQVAARSSRLLFSASSLIGRLYLQRRMPAAAVEWLERAAETPPPDADAGRELLYDLGDALMALEEHARALAVFLELQADAGEYRDVSRRIEQLSLVQAGG